MANVLSEEKRQQVITLGGLGWTLRRIEDATGVRRETASAYLKAAGMAVRPERGRRLPPKPASQVSTDPQSISGWPPRPTRSPQASACEPYREIIEEALGKGRNAVAIYQDLVTEHGFTARYASVQRYVRKLRGASTPQARTVIHTAAGEEAQVDYGSGPMVRDPKTGKYKRTRLFVLTLGCSRKAVRLLTFRSSTRIWAELHERAFRRLGATPRVLILDNLKEGILLPEWYDPELNPLYRDVLRHYGVTALPCRRGDPDRKGKVEQGVGHAKRTPLKGLRFESLEQAQAYLDRWERTWADTRIHGTTKRQVAVMFSEEFAHLQPLPLEPFRYYEYGERTVHLDGHVEVGAAYYSVPPGLIGCRVHVQWDERQVRILDPHSAELLREHRRNTPGCYRTHEHDRPPKTPPTTQQLLLRAQRIGPPVGVLCQEIHRLDGQIGVRRILGVLALGRKHGAVAINDACRVALELRLPTYRFVRRFLERRPQPQLSLKQIDPLIRELTQYRDLITQRTQEEHP